jgi:hypothetical protein
MNDISSDTAVYFLYAAIISVLLWFAFRLIILWYYKIDQRLAELQKQTDLLIEIRDCVKPKINTSESVSSDLPIIDESSSLNDPANLNAILNKLDSK